MARRPRPVDPTAGPIQAFAHDLRELREKAGNPTYRALARRAGYSAATLSEAARGQRRPSLDVTLAYVGACGGDLNEWRLRWHDLNTETRDKPPRPADPEPPGQPAPAPTPGRRWPRVPVPFPVVVVLILAVVAGGAILIPRIWSAARPRPGGCPDAESGAFTGQTYTFTRVRAAAALSAPVIRAIPAGCTVAFAGYCLGDTVTDETANTPDTRWFILPGGGVMASAVVHGNPPRTLTPSSCAANVAPPTTIRLTVSQLGNELSLRAAGDGVRIVGFTALHTSGSNGPRWQQISLTASAAPTFETRWSPDRSPDPPAPGQSIIVAAVACLGGDGPTTVIDARTIQPGDPDHSTPTALSDTALDAATRSACQYPDS